MNELYTAAMTDAVVCSYSKVRKHLESLYERETVAALLRDYEDVFFKGEFDVGCTRLLEHRIDTDQPVKHSVVIHWLDTIDEYVEELCERDMIESSAGPKCFNALTYFHS